VIILIVFSQGTTVLLIGFESAVVNSFEKPLSVILDICKKNGGTWKKVNEIHGSSSPQKLSCLLLAEVYFVEGEHAGSARQDEEAETWRNNFLKMPYVRDELILAGKSPFCCTARHDGSLLCQSKRL
jgi:hypothetical protein